MESKNTVYYKGDLIKTLSQSDFGNSTVIIDKKSKKTTTLMEALGRRTGYYITEEDEIKMKENTQKRMDSMRAARGGNEISQPNNSASTPEIEYTSDTKKIAGYNCKKAIIKTKSRQSEVSETIVWYTNDIKKPQDYPAPGNMGGGAGGFARGFRGGVGTQAGSLGLNGFDKIDGFIMGFSISRPNGFKMESEVNSVEVNPDIKDSIFDIPKGYELKPLAEMQSQWGRMAPGGPPRQ